MLKNIDQMNTLSTFTAAAGKCSSSITKHYSTSFSWAIRLLNKDIQPHIHAIYGFVRLADEIVDTFHDFNKAALLAALRLDTDKAIRDGISLNPVLHSFQDTVNCFNIPHELIDAFLHSMETDLDKKTYLSAAELEAYIYGSAEVVGLMCLYVFCEGREVQYQELMPGAKRLGAAFQKVNFLRDLAADQQYLERSYFPGIDPDKFDVHAKQLIEKEIAEDFAKAYEGIRSLPIKARMGVYVAYRYYLSLFNRIRKQQPAFIMNNRIRVPDYRKLLIILDAGLRNRMNMI
jgi:15-cis-phytoene synthase